MLTFQPVTTGLLRHQASAHHTYTSIPSPTRDCLLHVWGTPLPSRSPCTCTGWHSPQLSLHLTCPATDSLCQGWQAEKVGGKREGCFPAVNSWFEDGASLLQIDLIFPCPKMALRSTSSSALQHWLCPAPVLNPGRLRQTICKKRQTVVPYNLYLGESLITDFHSQMIFLYRNAIWKYKFSDLLHKYLRITLMGQQKLYQLKSCPVTPTGFIGLNSVSF